MGCNWGALLAQDRCKAIGVPWTEIELHAIHQLNIPADFVRNGVITLEEYSKTQSMLDDCVSSGKDKPLTYYKKAELVKKAGELGIPVVPEATRADLILLIQSKLPKENPAESLD